MRVPFRRRSDRPVDGSMTLMEHLYELRRRLFYAALGFFIGVVIGFVWYTNGIPAIGLKSLGQILIGPYCGLPDTQIVIFNGECSFLATGPFSALQVRINAALLVGAVLSSPVWLGQLWGFVTPALFDKEKKYARIFTGTGALLFFLGAALAYIIIPQALHFLLGFGGETVNTALDPLSYYSFLSAVLLIFGLAFELPLLLVVLNFAGVIKGKGLAKARRYSYFGIVVFCGLTVPGNDPFSMLALAGALCLLYELATQIALIHDRRKAKVAAAEGFGELDDDTASPTPVGAAPVGSAAADIAASPAPPTPEATPRAAVVPPPPARSTGHDLDDAT